jgi:hypothetical protein
MYLNGKMIAEGPARAGHGHHRVDEIDLTPHLTEGRNVLVVYVAGYYLECFCFTREPSFFCAEVLRGDTVLAATGVGGFEARTLPESPRRLERFSYQRTFCEYYRLTEDTRAYERDPEGYRFDPAWAEELDSVSHREYGTGFYFDDPMQNPQLVSACGYIREKAYFSTAIEYDESEAQVLRDAGIALENENGRMVRFIQRNKVSVNDRAEMISPGCIGRAFSVCELYGEDGTPIVAAPHPSMKFFARVPFEVKAGDIMRSGDV